MGEAAALAAINQTAPNSSSTIISGTNVTTSTSPPIQSYTGSASDLLMGRGGWLSVIMLGVGVTALV